MNSATMNNLYTVWNKIAAKTDSTAANRIIAPLTWYITTGRCSGAFIRKFNSLTPRQIATIVNRLIKFNGNDYDAAISSVKEYIG